MTWISVKNWESFQHYKDRRPPWIKLYEELLDATDLQEMSHTTQVVYFRLLLVACRRDNQIPHNISWLAEEMGVSRAACTSGLAALVASGHAIAHASKPASGLASKGASPRARTHSQETETETERSSPTTSSELRRANDADDEPDDLLQRLDDLDPSTTQRLRWTFAVRDNPELVERQLDAAVQNGRNPAALFDDLVQRHIDPGATNAPAAFTYQEPDPDIVAAEQTFLDEQGPYRSAEDEMRQRVADLQAQVAERRAGADQ